MQDRVIRRVYIYTGWVTGIGTKMDVIRDILDVQLFRKHFTVYK